VYLPGMRVNPVAFRSAAVPPRHGRVSGLILTLSRNIGNVVAPTQVFNLPDEVNHVLLGAAALVATRARGRES